MFNLVKDIISDYWQKESSFKKTKPKPDKPADVFKKFCESEPWAPECKVFDV